MHYLLVQPRFPIPNKSQNHKSFLPVGLLKIASWLRSTGDTVELVCGMTQASRYPDQVYVTSLFTYWSSHVWETVKYYRNTYPLAEITVGGIYASLAPDHCAMSGCDSVHVGVIEEAEKFSPAYDLVDTQFQIVHASRGCIRRCGFCGTHIIEPEYTYKECLLPEIVKRHLVFYDNNLLANPNIERILEELASARIDGRVVTSECQSGFDGRLLTTELARLIKQARLRNPRIAWDGRFEQAGEIREQIEMLRGAGYAGKDISVFMLYNFDLGPEETYEKAEQCFKWGVQVADCRYRPLDLYRDGYNPYVKSQPESEYYVHSGWTDQAVRGFRRRVRENNICVRYRIPRNEYRQELEGMSGQARRTLMRALGIDASRLERADLDRLNAEWRRVTEEQLTILSNCDGSLDHDGCSLDEERLAPAEPGYRLVPASAPSLSRLVAGAG